jgi:hypothetical protein
MVNLAVPTEDHQRGGALLNLGATVQGRVLLVVTTWCEDRVLVVTAFEPIKRLIQFYYMMRRNLPSPRFMPTCPAKPQLRRFKQMLECRTER